MKRYLLLAGVVVALCVVVVSFGTAQAAPAAQEGGAEPPPVTVPFLEEWKGSGHADAAAEAFRHWDEEDPKEIPANCAKCHSSTGYQDYLGADGSAENVVDAPAAIGTVVDCVACHNEKTLVKDSVIMPSGLVIADLGDESRCMECHQGRESKVSVDKAIADAGVEADAVSPDLGFRNIHYFAAAATKYGTLAKGGYEYDGNSYDANFAHVAGYDTCLGCHNSHTLEVKVEECATCHADDEMAIESAEDLKNIRMQGSGVDYDGDGDTDEGIAFEIEGLQAALMTAIQAYAKDVAGQPIFYDAAAYPYFFADANGNGAADEGEGGYDAWTPRLLKAAYNYQTSMKDPGAFAHGGKYIIQLLFDSIADLNAALAEPVDQTAMRRIDSGHFAGSEEAFRHWDAEGAVPASCAKCHSAGGLPQFIAEGGVVVSQPTANGFQCTTCHNDLKEFTIYEVKDVKFPSGKVIDSGNPDTNLCMSCHMGRESTVSVDKAIGDAEPDAVKEGLAFRNVHYFAAGATRWGTEAQGAYEYAGKEYAGFFDHADGEAAQCRDCHSTHRLEVRASECTECHEEVEGPENIKDIRNTYTDFDGDGDDAEGLYYEVEHMREALLAAIQAYAKDTVGTAIAYDAHTHPYWYIDTDGNGLADEAEVNSDNRYVTWTPRLLRAAYNYQYATKDPGSFAHNGPYILQTLFDSLEDIGGDVSAMTRP